MIKKGFTLIELLVVISIIGILATLIIANIGGVRERARDARRKNDISQIQKALELYKSDQAIPEYPDTGNIEALASDLEPDYMGDVPHDPRCSYDSDIDDWVCQGDWSDYRYRKDPGGTGDNLIYDLVVCLENASDPQRDSTMDSYCNGTSGAGGSITRREI